MKKEYEWFVADDETTSDVNEEKNTFIVSNHKSKELEQIKKILLQKINKFRFKKAKTFGR